MNAYIYDSGMEAFDGVHEKRNKEKSIKMSNCSWQIIIL